MTSDYRTMLEGAILPIHCTPDEQPIERTGMPVLLGGGYQGASIVETIC